MTIVRFKTDNRINISETVYKTIRLMSGTFSVENVLWDINLHLDNTEILSKTQVQLALNNLSKMELINKINSQWYARK